MTAVRYTLASVFALMSAGCFGVMIWMFASINAREDLVTVTIASLISLGPYMLGFAISSYALFRSRNWAWVSYLVLLLFHLGMVTNSVISQMERKTCVITPIPLTLALFVPIPVIVFFLILRMRNVGRVPSDTRSSGTTEKPDTA